MLNLGLYEFSCIVSHSAVDKRSDNAARQSLAIAYDGSLRLWCDIVYKSKTMIYVVKFVQQHVNLLQQLNALFFARNNAVYQFVVTCHNLLKLILERLIAVNSQFCCLYQLIGNTAESRHHNNYILRCCGLLDYAFQVQYTVYGTYRCSAEFHYFHL